MNPKKFRAVSPTESSVANGLESEENLEERDTKSPRMPRLESYNRSILSEKLIKELSSKLSSFEKIDDLVDESDFRKKFVEG